MQQPEFPPAGHDVVVALNDKVASLVRPVGGGLSNLIGYAVQKGPVPTALEDGGTEWLHNFCEEVFSNSESKVAQMLGPVGLAQACKLPRSTCRRYIDTLACAAYGGSMAFAASILSRIAQQQSAGTRRVVAVHRCISYDETPLGMCLPAEDDDPLAISAAGLPKSSKPASELCKLLQTELQLCIVSENLVSGGFEACVLTIPRPLQVIERGTASCMHTALRAAQHVPHLDILRTVAGPSSFHMAAGVADRAAANNSTEDALYAGLFRIPRVRLPCFAHCSSTAQGRAFNPVADETSGIISLALVMENSGCSASYRACVVDVLLQSIDVVLNAEPHGPGHPCSKYLQCVLSLCLPGTPVGQRSATALRALLTSDITRERISLRVVGGAIDQKMWARSVAALLLPRSIVLFPRHRWINSFESVNQVALLGMIHNILPRAGLKWLGEMRLKDVGASPESVAPKVQAWALSESEDDDQEVQEKQKKKKKPQRKEVVGDAIVMPDASKTVNMMEVWAAFNRDMKVKCERFFASSPQDRLMVMRIAMAPSVRFLRLVEHIASERWQVKAWSGTSSTKSTSRMQVAADGVFDDFLQESFRKLYRSEYSWAGVRPAGRTLGNAGIALAMLSSLHCALEQLVCCICRGIMFGLFCDLDPARVDFLLSSPYCLRGEFANRVLRHFDTPEKLGSKDFRAAMIGAALLLRWEICRIECRHALCRKWCRGHHTIGLALQELSSRFVLTRHRRLQAFFPHLDLSWVLGRGNKKKRNKRQRCCRRKKRKCLKGKKGGGPKRETPSG